MIFLKFLIIISSILFVINFSFTTERIFSSILFFIHIVIANIFHFELLNKALGVLPLIAFGTHIGLIYKYRHNISSKFSIIMAMGILSLIFISHNIIDGFVNNYDDKINTILNNWGLISCLILIFSNAVAKPYNIKEKNIFLKLMLIFSLIYFTIEVLTLVGFIGGNTEKMLFGFGGVGVGTMSTNETALIALVLCIVLIDSLESSSNFKSLVIFAIILNLTTIFITQSRIALICIGIILISKYIFNRRYIKYFPLYSILALPVYYIIKQRTAGDIDRRLPIGLEWAYAGSGRLIIWAEYILSYVDKYSDTYSVYLFGIGYSKLYDLYLNTNLHINGWVMSTVFFYPIHSDLLLLYFVGGGLAIFIYFYLLIKTYNFSANRKKYLLLSIILTIFLTFDMINYSQFSCLILGNLMYQANYHEDIQENSKEN